MSALDHYRDIKMDLSIGVNYPKGMSDVYTAVRALLESQGKFIVDDEPVTVAVARKMASPKAVDHRTYYLVDTDDPKVWGILRNPIEEDRIRVLGIFHGKLPDTLPQSMLIIDVGKSLHKKVSKASITAVSDALSRKGKYPQGKPEDIFNALLSLCYEVVYETEYHIFSKDVVGLVPRPRAFDFMKNPPVPLSDKSMRNAINKFVEDIHGYMV